MSVTPTEVLAGVLPAVISGGRPSIWERETGKRLHQLHGVTADPVWVVRDDQAPLYQPDGHEIVTYGRRWAEGWAKTHWTDVRPWRRSSFIGAFPGREFACQEARRRGCWAVLQLDDNIRRLSIVQGSATAVGVAEAHGGLGLFADLLAAVTRSTNSVMTGSQMMAVNPKDEVKLFVRTGFPYSLFIERVDTGEARQEWFGPFEDDIQHALAYGADNGDPGTAAVITVLRYQKQHQGRAAVTGMRASAGYDQARSAGLQRLWPQSALLTVQASHANGRGDPRVFHTTLGDAIRTPLAITDPALFGKARDYARSLVGEVAGAREDDIRRILETRAAGAARRRATAARRAQGKWAGETVGPARASEDPQ
jgi:hypothetical protein